MDQFPQSTTYHPQLTHELVPIKVRCPSCYKLYSVDPTEIKESKPRFQCVSCPTKFWIGFPESVGAGEVLGFPVEWIEKKPQPPAREPAAALRQEDRINADFASPSVSPAVAHVECPKCHKLYPRGSAECTHCGVVIAKWEELKGLQAEAEQGFPASPTLRKLWEEVLANYDSEDVHRRFMVASQSEKNLVFASRQYGRLLAAYAGDEMAQKMREQILALSQVSLSSPKDAEPATKPVKYWSVSSAVLFLGALLVVLGFFLQPLRNMVGVGVALIFFILAFRTHRSN